MRSLRDQKGSGNPDRAPLARMLADRGCRGRLGLASTRVDRPRLPSTLPMSNDIGEQAQRPALTGCRHEIDSSKIPPPRLNGSSAARRSYFAAEYVIFVTLVD